MNLSDFTSSIASPNLLAVAKHWLDVRGSRPMPAWEEISPAMLRTQLPLIWVWRYDGALDDFVGRLAGDAIERAFGQSFRGRAMREVFRNHQYERMRARHLRVMRDPAAFLGTGLIFRHLDRLDIGERIIMPLARDGKHGDGIIGATDARSQFGSVAEQQLPTEELEQWFSVA